jgi:hypothetical protein
MNGGKNENYKKYHKKRSTYDYHNLHDDQNHIIISYYFCECIQGIYGNRVIISH